MIKKVTLFAGIRGSDLDVISQFIWFFFPLLVYNKNCFEFHEYPNSKLTVNFINFAVFSMPKGETGFL